MSTPMGVSNVAGRPSSVAAPWDWTFKSHPWEFMVKLLSDELIKSQLCKNPRFYKDQANFGSKFIVLTLSFAGFVIVIYVISSWTWKILHNTIHSFYKHIYRTSVITTRGYYHFDGSSAEGTNQERILFKSRHYWKLAKIGPQKCDNLMKITILQYKNG